ncbi:hypothetical protein I3W98_39595, partial [Streptomyces cavourensis]|nr:hypothetical protein [Streptomyces cavourensis]
VAVMPSSTVLPSGAVIFVSRPHGSSPAVGSAKRHQAEQTQLVNEVFEA